MQVYTQGTGWFAHSDLKTKAGKTPEQTPLEQLANALIVRGSVYGVIGNTSLVMRARALVADSPNSADGKKATAELLDELETYNEAVERRIGASKKAERLRNLPAGMVWVCPATGATSSFGSA